MSDDAVSGIDDKTMIVVGDADGVDLDYVIRLFKFRGGADRKVAVQGFLSETTRTPGDIVICL